MAVVRGYGRWLAGHGLRCLPRAMMSCTASLASSGDVMYSLPCVVMSSASCARGEREKIVDSYWSVLC